MSLCYFLIFFILLAITTLQLLPFINLDLTMRLQMYFLEMERKLDREIAELEVEKQKDKKEFERIKKIVLYKRRKIRERKQREKQLRKGIKK